AGATTEVMVRIDEKRMAQVMSNLLSNAAKYSPTHGVVDISITTENDRVRISVHDSGKGIPEAFKSRIFSKFAQADSSDTRQKGGTGLGLNITKAIVENQGGSIGFDSVEEQGTTFYVELPVWNEQREAEAKRVEEADDDVHSKTPLVLIVEDDQDISRLLSMMLEKEGYRFHQAFSYPEAVQQIQQHHYDVMTLDLMIPGGSGLALLSELRGNEATVNLPVIVVSAKANEGKLEVEGAAFSMVDWIEKPIDEERLLESIRSSMSPALAKGGRLLHVEDDLDIATIVDTLLGDEYQVVHATTLKQARQWVSTEAFDLVLLDIGLPDGSGLELISTLNSQERQTPVIIFSAQDAPPAIAAQVRGVLIKSQTDNEKLMQQIKSAITKKS
ncbi:MAG: response regulator, partial [Pseudomonadota bacterium]|nr:response regulator [Pseudomonadota bacterium]